MALLEPTSELESPAMNTAQTSVEYASKKHNVEIGQSVIYLQYVQRKMQYNISIAIALQLEV